MNGIMSLLLTLFAIDSTQNTYSVNIQNAFLKSGTTKLPENLTREVESKR